MPGAVCDGCQPATVADVPRLRHVLEGRHICYYNIFVINIFVVMKHYDAPRLRHVFEGSVVVIVPYKAWQYPQLPYNSVSNSSTLVIMRLVNN